MAGQTPFHLKRIFLVNGRHIVDLSVAGRTTDALRDMNAVIEINKFGKIVDAFPLDRLILTKTGADRFEIRAVVPYLAVAIHTRLRRRHSGRGGCLYGRMTIPAINAVIAHVMFMAELDRLLFLEITPGEVRRPRDLCVNVKCGSRQNDRHDHADPGNVICTLVKELRHFWFLDGRICCD